VGHDRVYEWFENVDIGLVVYAFVQRAIHRSVKPVLIPDVIEIASPREEILLV
jgi:hypothetical protein